MPCASNINTTGRFTQFKIEGHTANGSDDDAIRERSGDAVIRYEMSRVNANLEE